MKHYGKPNAELAMSWFLARQVLARFCFHARAWKLCVVALQHIASANGIGVNVRKPNEQQIFGGC